MSGRSAGSLLQQLTINFSNGLGQPSINGGRLPEKIAHRTQNAFPIFSNGFLLDNVSHKIMPQLNISHFSVYEEVAKT